MSLPVMEKLTQYILLILLLAAIVPAKCRFAGSESEILDQDEQISKLKSTGCRPDVNLTEQVLVYRGLNGWDYYIGNDLTAGEYRDRARIDIKLNDGSGFHDLVTLELMGPNYAYIYRYRNMNMDRQLLTTSSTYYRSTFFFVPVNNDTSTGLYHLHVLPTNESIVAFGPKQPFKLYLQSRYPHEPPAQFYVAPYVLNVSDTYRGFRENITTTVALIRESTTVNKSQAYIDLLRLMEFYDHVAGHEIFFVGSSIAADIGIDGFLDHLPRQVWLICGGVESLRLYYRANNNVGFPMKYEWASDPGNETLFYKFTSSATIDKWGLTYADEHQLYVYYNSFEYPLRERKAMAKDFGLRLRLTQDYEAFEILGYRGGTTEYHLYTKSTEPLFYFEAGDRNPPPPSRFYVES